MEKIPAPRSISSQETIQAQRLQAQRASQAKVALQQVVANEEFTEECATTIEGLRWMRKDFKPIENLRGRRDKKEAEKAEFEETPIENVQEAEESASRFQKQNPELLKKSLLLLRDSLKETDTKDEILAKVFKFYPDPTLADDALDYIIQTTTGDIRQNAKIAKQELNETYQREIISGKNIQTQAREFSKEGLGSPTALRDMYRDITGNPRTANTLFDELASHFSFDKMQSVIYFLMHSLGADLKAKGSSIPRGELHRLIDDTQSLQAILGIYRFFQGRMNLLKSQFEHFGLSLSEKLTFELLAKQFMSLVASRYISSEKVLQLARMLGISEEVLAQIVIFTQMRDATRQTAPKLYRSDKHRQEILDAILDALENLEEQIEEEEE